MAYPGGSDGAPMGKDVPQPSSSSSSSSFRSSINSTLGTKLKNAKRLSIEHLEVITDNFSPERVIGRGTYGTVYKGVYADGKYIAVKVLHKNTTGTDNGEFKHEFESLMRLKHQNIIKLVGFCFETQHKPMLHDGETIFAEDIYKALCFEYMQNGNLKEHISVECDGLEWHTRFKIIKGICEGLKYLHEEFKEPIYHLDLKPENILLDDNMVPKLADFGSSKLFGKELTMVIPQNLAATIGYVPPEYYSHQVVSKKFDIFSLGVVMTKIIAGPRGNSLSAEMDYQDFLDQVHKNWRKRFQEKGHNSVLLQAYCQQVNICITIALNCMDYNRFKRPGILHIIDKLNETETVIEELDPDHQWTRERITLGDKSRNEATPIPACSSSERAKIDALLSKLCSPDPEEQRLAAAELRLLANRYPHSRLCIADAGAIPLLLSLLSSSDLRTQEHAVTALLNLSIHEDNKARIVSSGAVPSVVHVLKNGSMEARENAAATLLSLSVVYEYKISIGITEAIPALVVLLNEGSRQGKKDAAEALFNLCIYQGNKGRAIRAGLVPLIMGLVTNPTGALVDEAMEILSILSRHQEGKAAIGAAEPVPALVQLLGSGSPRNRENAAAVMLHLCRGEQQLVHLARAHECGILVPLRELALNGTEREKRKALLLLKRMNRFLVQQQEEQESHSRFQATSAQVLRQASEQVQESEIRDQLDSPASQYPTLL